MENNEIYLRVTREYLSKVSSELGIPKEAKGLHPTFKIKKRRTAMDRLKSRMAYRRNKNKIKQWRKRYSQKRQMLHASRKLLKRSRPKWLSGGGSKSSKPKKHVLKSFLHNLHKRPTKFKMKRPSSHGLKNKYKIHKPKVKNLKPFKPRRPDLISR